VEPLFQTLCDCAALNPDSDIDDEDAGDFFFSEAEVMADPEARAAMLAARMAAAGVEGGGADDDDMEELVGGGDPGRFEDD